MRALRTSLLCLVLACAHSAAPAPVWMGDARLGTTDLSEVVRITGDLLIGAEAAGVIELPRLTEVGGSVRIEASGAERVRLEALASVGGSLVVARNRELQLFAPRRLARVGGEVRIEDNRALLGTELAALTEAQGLSLVGNDALLAIELPLLARLDGELEVTANARLQRLALQRLAELSGGVRVADCSSLVGASFDALIRVGGDVRFQADAALAQLDLPALTEVAGSLRLGAPGAELPGLERLALAALRSLGEALELHGTALQKLELPALAAIGGALLVERNRALTRIELGRAAARGVVHVGDNDLSRCTVQRLRASLAAEQGSDERRALEADHDDCGRDAFDAQEIATILARARPEVASCVRDAALVGRISPGSYELRLTLRVEPDRAVSRAAIQEPALLREARTSACIVSALRRLRFPPPDSPTDLTGVALALEARAPWRVGARAGEAVVQSVWGSAAWRHEPDVRAVALRADGALAASGASDGSLRVWGAAGATHVLRPAHGAVIAVGFSGQALVAAHESGRVDVWDLERERVSGGGAVPAPIEAAVLAADGCCVYLACRDGVVRAMRLTGRVGESADVARLGGEEGQAVEISGIALDAAARRLAVGSADGEVALVHLASGELHGLASPSLAFQLVALALDPAGTRVVATGWTDAATLRVWDAGSGELLREVASEVAPSPLFFSADGGALFAARGELLEAWSASTWKPARLGRAAAGITTLAPSADGALLITGDERGGVELWDVDARRTRQNLAGHTDAVVILALSADGARGVSTGKDGTLRLWDAASGSLRATLAESLPAPVTAADISADGARVLWGDADGSLHLYDFRSGVEQWSQRAHAGAVRAVDLSADGERLVTAGEDGVMVRSASTGTMLGRFEGHGGPVTHVALSPDGSRAASAGAELLIWDVDRGAQLRSLGAIPVERLLWAAGGRYLAAASARRISLWSSGDGELVHTFGGFARDLVDAAVSPDGQRLAAVVMDGTLRLWRVEPGELMHSIAMTAMEGAHATSVAFAREDVVIGQRDGLIVRWRLDPRASSPSPGAPVPQGSSPSRKPPAR